MTSSPGFRFSALRGNSSASVPLAQPTPCLACDSRAIAVSSSGTAGPMMNCCVSTTFIIAASTSSLIELYCATRSSMGTFMTRAPSKVWSAAARPPPLRRWPRTRRTPPPSRRARMQSLTALAHPPHAARRHADHQAVGGHVGRDHGARADERVLAECDAANDGRVGPDGAAALHERAPVFVLARDVAARVHHVGEHAGGPAEDVVFQLDALVNRDVVLDLDVVADFRPGHHDDVLAEVAALAVHGAGHDVRKVPDLGAAADYRSVVDIAGLVCEIAYGPMILHSSSRVTPVFLATVFRTCSITLRTSLAVAVPLLMM